MPLLFLEPNASESSVKEDGPSVGDSRFSKRDFADQFESAYDTVVSNWVAAKDYKARADAIECVGTLSLMISEEKILKDLKKLIMMFMGFYKKADQEQQYAITKASCFRLIPSLFFRGLPTSWTQHAPAKPSPLSTT